MSKLREKFLKSGSKNDKKAYNKQRTKCISLLRKTKKAYYSNLNMKDVVDNKKFLKTIKSFFFEKSNKFENIYLIENDNLLTDDFEIAETFNKYFQNLVPNLDLKVPSNLLCQTPENGDEILAAIYKYQNHPSIKTILEKCNFSFSFKTVSLTDVEKEMKSLNTNKASHSSDIPTKILKQNVDFFSPFILDYVNKSISSSTFPSILKLADIIPVYKKDSRYEKSNYRPISVLPNLSKIFENVLYDQISSFFENIFSKYQTGFRKGFSPQSCLVAMIEKFKKSLDQGGEYAALLTDLSKAFDCLPHDLIIAKLHAYGFDKASLRLMHSYLTDRYQRVKINNSYSLWSLIKHGVPQGSILGPTLFNIYLCDMFFIVDSIDTASYADNNTSYSVGKSHYDLETKLQKASVKLFKWFHENGLKANQEKCHFLLSLDINTKFSLPAYILENSISQKLPGVTIDRKLSFNEHITKLCDKASKKNSSTQKNFPIYTPNTKTTLNECLLLLQQT